MTYPLDIAGRRVVVLGGDARALGHVAQLRDAGADVTVVAARVVPSIEDLHDRGLITWDSRAHSTTDLDDAWLVVACTGDPSADRAVATAAEQRRTFCVVAEAAATPASEATGSVVLVGGGPGDPGLLTLAGKEALANADVIVTDRLAPLAALRWARPGAEIIDVAKVPGGRSTSQEDINRVLVDNALAGRAVVRFKGGDNFVFGRGGEELIACAAAGIPTRVVPGVSSAIAAPAAAGIPVTHRGLNQAFTVISGHVPPGDPLSTVDYAALARSGSVLVLLMAVKTLPAIAEALLAGGLPAETPAAAVSDGGLRSQVVVRATLATLAASVAAAGLTAPAVTVIGAVADIDGLR